MPAVRLFRVSRSVALFASLTLFAVTAGALAADLKTYDPFPPAKRAAIDAALSKAFAASKAPGVVVGIWIAGR